MAQEIREDITTRDRVIFAGGRGDRPSDFEEESPRTEGLPEYDPACPFCPGNENLIPPILEEFPGGEREWWVRVIPNKYPILDRERERFDAPDTFYQSRPAGGKHEIIIENPRHDLDLSDFSAEALTAVLEAYRRRWREIREKYPEFKIVIFRNRGVEAGTSLLHPHSQLIAGSLTSPLLKRREEISREYFLENKRCLYCDIVSEEEREGRRVVAGDESFLVFVPFAAVVPFETWIIPRKHQPEFGGIAPAEIPDLARRLKKILRTLKHCLGDFSYNYIFSAPFLSPQSAFFSHWHLKIHPRITRAAGFELETGIRVNPILPETAAARLREKLSD